jgi:hypothetical protein
MNAKRPARSHPHPTRARGPAAAIIAGALTVAGTFGACADDRGPEARAGMTIDTLASGTIAVRNTGPAWGPGEGWTPVEVFRIGSAEAEDPYIFSGAWTISLAIDTLDRIYVADLQTGEVRLFDADGTYLRTVAATGEGPGEVTQPAAMAVDPENRVWVVDPANARYSAFDSTGVVRMLRREEVGFGIPWWLRFGADSRLYERGSILIDRERRDSEEVLNAYRLGADALVQEDTVRVVPAGFEPPLFEIDYGDGSRMMRGVPFAPQFRWAFDGRDGIWAGRGDEYRLVHRSLGGDTLRVVERPARDQPVDPSVRDEAMAWVDDLPRPSLRRQVDAARVPDVVTEFDRILVDDRGYVWVGVGWQPIRLEGAYDPARFDVFTPEGEYLGMLTLPFHPRPYPAFRGDLVVGVTEDELGVPRIVGYRLEGRDVEAGR